MIFVSGEVHSSSEEVRISLRACNNDPSRVF